MSETVRLYRYQELLRSGHPVSKERLMSETEVSLATFKRDIAKLRDQLNFPIEFDRESQGYVLRRDQPLTELPGFWFSPDEIIVLATIQSLLLQLAPSLMAGQLNTVRERLNKLLEKNGINPSELASRIQLMPLANRQPDGKVFGAITVATLERKRLTINHHNRQRDEIAVRQVSPIDIEYYRDNWYLTAWCHTRNDIRRFAIDAITKADVSDDPAQEVSPEDRDQRLRRGYGIFSGTTVTWARIRFSAERSKWIENETWHPQQKVSKDESGRVIMEIPYSDARELISDILRHGADAEVIAPKALRESAENTLRTALENYQ